MDDILRRVLAQVETNRAALIEDVAACVRIPSVVGHEGPVQEFMRARYAQLGLEVDVFEADRRQGCTSRHGRATRSSGARAPGGTCHRTGRPSGLLEGQCRQALTAEGFDLSCGCLHADKQYRDSLVYDLMELFRPAVDALVLGFLERTAFAYGDMV